MSKENQSELYAGNTELIRCIKDLEEKLPPKELLQKALEGSELRYRRLFESAQDGILILDADTGFIVDVNPFLLTLLGYSCDEMCGKQLWEIGEFKDIAESKDSFKVLQDNEYIRYDDLPLKTRTGQVVEVEFVSNVYLDLIITDQTMPGLAGVELIRRIWSVRPGIPAVICTGHSELIDEELAEKLGIAALVRKPYDIDNLGSAAALSLADRQASK